MSNVKWDIIISPSLRLLLKVWVWYNCQNRIGKYYHHDGEQLTFYQKILHIITHRLRKEDCLCNLCIAINSNLLDKNHSQYSQMPYSTWKKLILMNPNWTGKLQLTLLFAYIPWNKFCSHTFKASSEEKIVMWVYRKWRQNTWRRICERVFS